MNYRVRRQGEELGVLPLEELRRRRESGGFTGSEYVQREGASDWQPLDLVLQAGYRVTPPPLPSSVPKTGPGTTFIWVAITGAVLLLVVGVLSLGLFVHRVRQRYQSLVNSAQSGNGLTRSNPKAVAAASQPIAWTSNTLTAVDVRKRYREFVTREWLEEYEKRGRRNPEYDAAAVRFLQAWIANYHGDGPATNRSALERMGDRLASDTNCTDPLVLTVTALNCIELHETIRRLERALAGFPTSKHESYPRLYATVTLAADVGDQPARVRALDQSALSLFRTAFTDGSFRPPDQQTIADFLVNGWAYSFFKRNAPAVCRIAHQAGTNYRWLALVLDGASQIDAAWRARGNGWANSVTATGWQRFKQHLAEAQTDLTHAWHLRPGDPLAPCLMIKVALGDAGIEQMRLWFDRTLAGQLDYPGAWDEMRWGLRPRWYGNERAMLALGVAAINTGRFDTDVPRKYFDCVADVESEMELPPGQYLFGRSDVWTNLQRMYEGYLAAPSQKRYRNGWRSSYAVVAYFAGKYDVARAQLQALNWKPQAQNLTGWGKDLSLMPWEVAARTGPLRAGITAAEANHERGDVPEALQQYRRLDTATNSDERTRAFIRHRLAALRLEQRLQKGAWVAFLPSRTNHPNWVFARGKVRQVSTNSLEVQAGPGGHFLFSRVRVGPEFEVQGQFVVVHSSNRDFQAGLILGTPDFGGYNWDSLRMKRNQYEGDLVSFARGWTKRQITQPVTLNAVTNSFDFRFHWNRVSATVNGIRAFQEAKPPATIRTSPHRFLLGLGAYNDSNETVIRYQNVRVRRLTSADD